MHTRRAMAVVVLCVLTPLVVAGIAVIPALARPATAQEPLLGEPWANLRPAANRIPAAEPTPTPCPPEGSSTCWAENMSQATTCAEDDNVNVPIYDPQVMTFRVTATHPTYDIGEDNCDPDFSGCDGGAKGGEAQTLDTCTEIWNDGVNVINVCTVPDWWRGDIEMNVTAGQQTESGHYLQWYRKIEDEASWPQILVLYQDGNVRLKPHPPLGRADVCFGSSVIIGPAPPAERPYVDIEEVSIDPGALSLDITYLDGQWAHAQVSVDRSQATVHVTVGYATVTDPVATFRSMWVSDANSDVDHADAPEGEHPILGGWSSLVGPWWFFHRDVRSTHNTSASDIRIEMLDQRTPVGGIAELPRAVGRPLEVPDSSRTGAAIVAAATAAGAVVVVTAGSAAWYARRRWLR